MSVEIERKFLVVGDDWRRNAVGQESMRQGYLSGGGNCSVRVRMQGDGAFLNIKEAVVGRERLEFDYAIPVEDARDMLERLASGPLIEKTRYRVQEGDDLWEIDVFQGENAGLVVAEIELPSVDATFGRPDWLGQEVTHLRRYYNVSLSEHPYSKWSEEERA